MVCRNSRTVGLILSNFVLEARGNPPRLSEAINVLQSRIANLQSELLRPAYISATLLVHGFVLYKQTVRYHNKITGIIHLYNKLP
jgi:hypothetical protein